MSARIGLAAKACRQEASPCLPLADTQLALRCCPRTLSRVSDYGGDQVLVCLWKAGLLQIAGYTNLPEGAVPITSRHVPGSRYRCIPNAMQVPAECLFRHCHEA